MEIKELDKDIYGGQEFEVKYTTTSYLDIDYSDLGFAFIKRNFTYPVEKSFKDKMLSEWLENPLAYGFFHEDKMIGFVEGSLEEWNNRFRISNIAIFDESFRHHGIGTLMLDLIIDKAKKSGARMAVLETQSCNEAAIAFYQKYGFKFIGLDVASYSNDDLARHEVRLELGYKLVED